MNIIKGKFGEELAIKYLKKNKYKIIETNYKNKIGEIDIIASIENTIVFVEVKTRTNTNFGEPRFAVNNFKQNKIKLVATSYLQKTNNLNAKVRFDVIEILNNDVTHIINAF